MKRFLFAAAAATVAAAAVPAFAADVGVSVSVGDPGFYGRIDIGNVPPPQLIYAQPVIVQPVAVAGPPLYLHVPPGHAKHWSKNCYRYNACGQRVYFVQDSWYNNVYVPSYREHRGGRGEHRDGYDNGNNDRGHDGDHDRGHDRGHGKGHDKDHGNGHKGD
ncbi:hypothetical protein ACFQAT_11020 [Undibacterium arcticum]|uniref:Uncharacterized protein n=1 Tax=Undibacterium arcticum TaxID=1762892 RepID=A0ABV7F1H6_9BURK